MQISAHQTCFSLFDNEDGAKNSPRETPFIDNSLAIKRTNGDGVSKFLWRSRESIAEIRQWRQAFIRTYFGAYSLVCMMSVISSAHACPSSRAFIATCIGICSFLFLLFILLAQGGQVNSNRGHMKALNIFLGPSTFFY